MVIPNNKMNYIVYNKLTIENIESWNVRDIKFYLLYIYILGRYTYIPTTLTNNMK